MKTREEMIHMLTSNEISWLAGGNANHEELQDSIKFFAAGGYNTWSDDDIRFRCLNMFDKEEMK